MKRFLAFLLTLCLLLGMMSTLAFAADAKTDDIVILHHGVLQEVRREDLADEAYKDRIIAALKEEPDVV